MDWSMTKNKPDGGNRCSNKFCIGAIACRGSKFGSIGFGVSGVSFGAAEVAAARLQQQCWAGVVQPQYWSEEVPSQC